MDLDNIKSVVLNQLTGTNGLYSLKLQNHIYGCFIIMEDIAQSAVDVSGNIIYTPKFSFDLGEQFVNIGIRYGFAMDGNLALDTYSDEYKNMWIELFRDIDLQKDINEVDKIEDCLIAIIQTVVNPEDAFFLSALETGSLPQEWIERAFNLINPRDEDNTSKTMISKAQTEKPLRTKKKLAVTRRHNFLGKSTQKKRLSTTRRQHFLGKSAQKN
jgi:hypothetical protein